MKTATILALLKARIGISSDVRDTYLTAIVDSIITELEDEKGIVLDEKNMNQVMFIVDYATWRYQNRDGDKGIPRHLQFRLHNLIIHNGGGTGDL
ncbi:hypothetical protein [Tissierella sp.]|uniref:hypothetical protein n=1 Tax=Tissierella sp. TaxID=41274 RepID=UPI0030400DDA